MTVIDNEPPSRSELEAENHRLLRELERSAKIIYRTSKFYERVCFVLCDDYITPEYLEENILNKAGLKHKKGRLELL